MSVISTRFLMNNYRIFRYSSMVLATLGQACAGGDAQVNEGRVETAIPVAASRVSLGDLAREVVLTGPIEPIRIVGVNSRAAGTVMTVRVVEGDRVRPGRLMAELDDRETRAQLERARAMAVTAEAALRRAEQLLAAELIAESEFEATEAQYATAKADMDLWQTRLEFSRIEAPGSGVVVQKYIEAGSAVSPNQRLFDVADDSLLVVRVRMSELDVVQVQPGDAVKVRLDAFPGDVLQGTVRRIFPSADPATRLVPVEVSLGDPRRVEVRPGFLARVRFPLERRVGVIVVPEGAVGASPLGPYVYVVEADTLVRRTIGTGLSADGNLEVVAGLEVGEQVVVSGQLSLREGALVRVRQQGPPALEAADSQPPATLDGGSSP